jgi:glycosyltransferase involved in cell wall biosynthesis
MKLAVIVTEYPKGTETFIYRDLVKWEELGIEVHLYPLAPLRANQPLHGFAETTRKMVRDIPLFGAGAMRATLAALTRQPFKLLRAARQIAWAYRTEPKFLVKSLTLIPKALAIAADAKSVGASHVHAEFAGHPATAAWIGRRLGGLDYSVSCRAHDIFRTQRLLDLKLGEASAVRTVSNFAERFIRKSVPALAGREIHVIHSSVDVARIPAAAPAPGAPFRILYVGALEPKKGVEHLIDALALAQESLGDWRCDIIGQGPSADPLKARAAERGLGERIVFHGGLPFEAVAQAYRKAHLCIAPSIIGPSGRQEGIPNVMIEALAYQRPAISTAISGIPELIRDGDTGLLVPPADPRALADAILRIYSNPQEAAAMAKRGRRHVEGEFDLAVNARRQLAMFGETALAVEAHGKELDAAVPSGDGALAALP